MPSSPDYTPTEKQLAYLKNLGYVGSQPKTISEASDLISAMKDGLSSESAEESILFDRASPIEKARLYLAEAEQRKRDGSELAGWRLKVKRGAETAPNAMYNGAFLPFNVGRQFPELLAISGLDFDTELQRRPAKGPVVTAPNQLSEITLGSKRTAYAPKDLNPKPNPKKNGGCLGVLLLLFAGAVSFVLFM